MFVSHACFLEAGQYCITAPFYFMKVKSDSLQTMRFIKKLRLFLTIFSRICSEAGERNFTYSSAQFRLLTYS